MQYFDKYLTCINRNKTRKLKMGAEYYVSDFALSMSYYDIDKDIFIPRQCLFESTHFGFKEFGEEPMVLYNYQNFCFMHGGMGKLVEDITNNLIKELGSGNILNKINVEFYNYLLYNTTCNENLNDTIYYIMNDRTFGEIALQNIRNKISCEYLETILHNINKLKGISNNKIDTMIIGHCPQYLYYTQNNVTQEETDYYHVYGTMELKGNYTEDIEAYHEYSEPVDTRSQKELYEHVPPKLGITMGCPKNENNYKLYRIDVGMSRAFDIINNNICVDIDIRYLYMRRPQVLKIAYDDTYTNYKTSVLKSSIELMEEMMPRYYCNNPFSQSGGYKKYLKYINKIAKLLK